MIIQILVCVAIYGIIYTIQNSNYVFSEEFLKKVNEVLSYDTNFSQIYENIKNQIMSWIPQKEEQTNQEGIGGAEEITPLAETTENQEQIVQEQNQENNPEVQQEQPISQEEQYILNIKNTTSFIKPVE